MCYHSPLIGPISKPELKGEIMLNIQGFSIGLTAVFLAAPAAFAEDYSVSRHVEITGSPEAAWQAIGDFCDIDDWHPAILGCALRADGGSVQRHLTLSDGGTLVERLVAVDAGGLTLTYAIVSSPLPLERYTSTLSITRGDPSIVTWSGRFTTDDAELEAFFEGFYDAGLAQIAAQFGG